MLMWCGLDAWMAYTIIGLPRLISGGEIVDKQSTSVDLCFDVPALGGMMEGKFRLGSSLPPVCFMSCWTWNLYWG
jgi:hypothetical protein